MGLEEANIIPDIIDRVASASAVELEVSFHGKAIKVGADKQGKEKGLRAHGAHSRRPCGS